MSFYWVCLGDTIQPQPMTAPGMMNGAPVVNNKLPLDLTTMPITAGTLSNKHLTSPQIFIPTIDMQDIKVNNVSPTNHTKIDNSRHFHVFVGDLTPDLEAQQLRDAFGAFGQISDCKIIRDPQSFKSKGYGFVSFFRKEEAENAIIAMNGQWIGSRPIRTNWASRKPLAPNQKEVLQKTLSYEEVYSQTSPTNCTVYCGGIITGLTDELIEKTFGAYGSILEIRAFKEKGYAFIRFNCKEAAAEAIVGVHATEVNGHIVKCAWGKEPKESSSSLATGPTLALLAPTAQGFPYSQQISMGQQLFGPTGYGNGTYTSNYPQTPIGHYMQPCVQTNGYGSYQCCFPIQWTAPTAAAQTHLMNQSSAAPSFLGYPAQQSLLVTPHISSNDVSVDGKHCEQLCPGICRKYFQDINVPVDIRLNC